MKWKLLLLSSALIAGAAQAQTPTPLGTIKREPFTAKPTPEPEPKPQTKAEPQMEWRRDTERQVRRWWQPMPPGWVACSIDPYGRQVCGNGYWVEVR